MRKKLLALCSLGLAVGIFAALNAATASAAWNANKIMDDGVFNHSTSMNSAQIDSFLNSFPNSCISPNRGFSAPNPTGYSPSGGYTYGGNVSAGTVIESAAKAYDLNPRVLLATLQKEQSLVNGNAGCSVLRYVGATGYGCPDGGTTHNYSGLNLYTINGNTVTSVNGTCVNSALKAGFSQQVIRGAWLLKFGQQRSLGNTSWAIIRGSWDNSDDLQSCYSGPMTKGWRKTCPNGSESYYDGLRSIDGQTVTIESGATAALYWYTPHLHGNQNFILIWENWWGNTYNSPAFLWEKISMKIWDEGKNTEMTTDQLHMGERLFVEITAKNTGNQTWWRDHDQQARFGLQAPNPHKSQYCDALWMWCSRAAKLKEASVEPGGIGHFEFYIHAPNQGGVFREYFEPVLEGHSWMDNDEGFNIYVNSTNRYDWRWGYFDAWTDGTKTTRVNTSNLAKNQQFYVELKIKNKTTVTWTKSGAGFTRLATSGPLDRDSIFCHPDWELCSRPSSIRETSVAPGQWATFGFTMKAPNQTGEWREYFRPILERKNWGRNDSNHIFLKVTH